MGELLQTNARKLRIYRKRNFKFDFIAAIVVFLVAIPLCLGIALASGAPLFSGILSGIVGGIIVGTISGSHVSVSGPAAGMVAVVIAAINQLGSFDAFLLAVVIAGIIQIITGSFKAGFIAEYIPSNVIQGLLCAIGILLIIKQLPLAFTLSKDLGELKTHLLEATDSLAFEPLYFLSSHINTGAMVLSSSAIAVLIYFDRTKAKYLNKIPGPIVVVILGIVLNEIFVFLNSSLAQNSPQLVNLPVHDGISDLISQINYPNFNTWHEPKVYLYGLIIAVVASLESLLSVKAGEKLDKKKRRCSKDQELVAQGIGNVAAGLIGGIPVTSVIVRTTVNIQSGSKTKFSAILHGIFILLAVILIPHLLNKIPLSTLAAILIYTGYKLSKPAIYKNLYQQGLDRFIPFIVTIICIVVFNLLTGIIIGLFASFFYILKSSSQVRLDIIKEIYPHGESNRLVLPQQTTFLNKASLIAELDTIPKNSQLIIDARYTNYIDKDVLEFLQDFKKDQARAKNLSLNLIGFKDHYEIHNYVDFINVTTYDIQSMLKPAQVLTILKEGNQRFLNDTRIHRSLKVDIKHTAETQHPIAVVLACIDSRVPVETIFDMSFGDLFCIRVAGNVINEDVLASMEFACDVVGAKLIVVLGHTRCGAINAACDHVKEGHITQLLEKIEPAINAETQTKADRCGKNSRFVHNVTRLNVAHTISEIYKQSPILQKLINDDNIGIVGSIYDVNTGIVSFKDYAKDINKFAPEDTKLHDKVKKLIKK